MSYIVFQWIFWISFLIILYFSIGYPLVLVIISKSRRLKHKSSENYLPKVSLIIAAFNEEKIIEEKIKNSLSLDYPQDKLEIIVASDASTDQTDEIVRSYQNQGIILYRQDEHLGKTNVQNEATKIAQGEILVFSDATGMYNKDAVRKLVRNFADPNIGCVAGELKYVSLDQEKSEEGEGIYWKYEQFIKKMESKTNSLSGVNGAIYALRKGLYVPLPPDIISDFVEPLEIFKNSHRIVYEKEALCFERSSKGIEAEFRRKVRIIVRGLRGLAFEKALLNPLKYGLMSFQLISHKLLRWFLPLFLITLILANFFLISSPFFLVLFWLQIIFYLFAFVGFILDKSDIDFSAFARGYGGSSVTRFLMSGGGKLFHLPLYFCTINLAALIALIKFTEGEKKVIWQTER